MKPTDAAKAAEKAILRAALRYPDTHVDHPWGETVVKVKGKVFVFLGASEGRLGVTTKLPRTGPAALALPFTEPCGYGLGKSGWVTARFDAGEDIPVDLLVSWLDESYRAVAPKRSIAALDDGGGPSSTSRAPRRTSTKKAAPRRATAKKAASKGATAKKTKKVAKRKVRAGR